MMLNIRGDRRVAGESSLPEILPPWTADADVDELDMFNYGIKACADVATEMPLSAQMELVGRRPGSGSTHSTKEDVSHVSLVTGIRGTRTRIVFKQRFVWTSKGEVEPCMTSKTVASCGNSKRQRSNATAS